MLSETFKPGIDWTFWIITAFGTLLACTATLVIFLIRHLRHQQNQNLPIILSPTEGPPNPTPVSSSMEATIDKLGEDQVTETEVVKSDEDSDAIKPRIIGEPIDISNASKKPLLLLNFTRNPPTNSTNRNAPSVKCTVDTEGFENVLKKVGPRSFVLLSINGQKRLGKSTALNHILRYLTLKYGDKSKKTVTKTLEVLNFFPGKEKQDSGCLDYLKNAPLGKGGFDYGGGSDVVTKGILMWPEPFLIPSGHSDDSKEFCIILMDTQGLFDMNTTVQENSVLYSFSSLCSSVMIYNSRDLDDSALQNVEYFAKFANSLFPQGMSLPQQLIFLIRDFQFSNEFKYGHHTIDAPVDPRKNYWKSIFHPDPLQNPIPIENQEVRQGIRKAFTKVDMFLLPDPGSKYKQKPENNSHVVMGDEDFVDFMNQFVTLLDSPGYLTKKAVNGIQINGNDFISYVQNWAREYHDMNTVPTAPRLAELSRMASFENLKTICVALYTAHMRGFMKANPGGTAPRFVQKAHEAALKEAQQKFDNGIKKLRVVQSLQQNQNKHFQDSVQLHFTNFQVDIQKFFERQNIFFRLGSQPHVADVINKGPGLRTFVGGAAAGAIGVGVRVAEVAALATVGLPVAVVGGVVVGSAAVGYGARALFDKFIRPKKAERLKLD